MPLINVNQVLRDPLFRTTFSVRSGTQIINAHGRAVLSETTTRQSGVVYPAKGVGMFRIAEGEHVSDDITVVTKFRLTNGQDNVQADIVIWGGREWTVIALEDFSEYGEGFIAAHCRKRTLND